jgi:hypothetical protein
MAGKARVITVELPREELVEEQYRIGESEKLWDQGEWERMASALVTERGRPRVNMKCFTRKVDEDDQAFEAGWLSGAIGEDNLLQQVYAQEASNGEPAVVGTEDRELAWKNARLAWYPAAFMARDKPCGNPDSWVLQEVSAGCNRPLSPYEAGRTDG